MLTRRADRPELDGLASQFSLLAVLGAIALVVTGVVSALAGGGAAALDSSVRGGPGDQGSSLRGHPGVAARGRRLAVRLAFRRQHQQTEPVGGRGGRQLAGVLRVELVSTVVVLASTAALVLVAPHP